MERDRVTSGRVGGDHGRTHPRVWGRVAPPRTVPGTPSSTAQLKVGLQVVTQGSPPGVVFGPTYTSGPREGAGHGIATDGVDTTRVDRPLPRPRVTQVLGCKGVPTHEARDVRVDGASLGGRPPRRGGGTGGGVSDVDLTSSPSLYFVPSDPYGTVGPMGERGEEKDQEGFFPSYSPAG